LPHAMAGRFGRDHGNVNGFRRFDRAKTDVEAVREHERLARLEVWLNRVAIEFRLLRVRSKNHDDIGPSRSLCRRVNGQPFLLGFGARSAGFGETHSDLNSAIAQVQRMCMSLRAVANDGHLFSLNEREIRGVVVIEISHGVLSFDHWPARGRMGYPSVPDFFRDARTRVQILKLFPATTKGVYSPSKLRIQPLKLRCPAMADAANRFRASWKCVRCAPSPEHQSDEARRASRRLCPRCRKLRSP